MACQPRPRGTDERLEYLRKLDEQVGRLLKSYLGQICLSRMAAVAEILYVSWLF
jgi:hypothetical protein